MQQIYQITSEKDAQSNIGLVPRRSLRGNTLRTYCPLSRPSAAYKSISNCIQIPLYSVIIPTRQLEHHDSLKHRIQAVHTGPMVVQARPVACYPGGPRHSISAVVLAIIELAWPCTRPVRQPQQSPTIRAVNRHQAYQSPSVCHASFKIDWL